MTAEHTTINLTPAELTGQKPMQPLLGTEHYQCMDSLFIRGSIRHRSLRCHTGYETDRQQVNAGRSGKQWRNRAHDMIAYTAEAIPENSHFMFVCKIEGLCNPEQILCLHAIIAQAIQQCVSFKRKKPVLKQN